MYDYEFSSDIDVILKGYYPVAAYLWIWGGDLNLLPISPPSCPCGFFHQTPAIVRTPGDGVPLIAPVAVGQLTQRAEVPPLL